MEAYYREYKDELDDKDRRVMEYREEQTRIQEDLAALTGTDRAARDSAEADLTVICWGAMRQPVMAAVSKLKAAQNVRIEVIDLLTISPMDTETILKSVSKTKRCLVVQEAARSFSVSSEIVTRINDGALRQLASPVMRVTGYDVVVPCAGRESLYYPSVGRIRRAMEELLDLKIGANSCEKSEQPEILEKEYIH